MDSPLCPTGRNMLIANTFYYTKRCLSINKFVNFKENLFFCGAKTKYSNDFIKPKCQKDFEFYSLTRLFVQVSEEPNFVRVMLSTA